MRENKKLKVGVIFGGLSAENEVSLATGRYVYSLLDPLRFTAVPIYLDKSGRIWKVPDKLVIQNTTADVEARLEKEAELWRFEDLPSQIDLVFNALLGKYGEDGCLQGLLELLGLPYTGSGILASALGMNKKVHRQLLSAQGLNIARGIEVDGSEFDLDKLKTKIAVELGFPCVVKPTREGSSIGVSVVQNGEQLKTAFEYAFKYDREVLVEEYLRGLEFTCVVWGNREPRAMLPTEVVFEGDFFTYEGKYMPGKTQTITPARLKAEVLTEIQEISVKVYKLIGCLGYGRIDGFVVPQVDGEGSKPDCSDLNLSGVRIYVTEPHTGTIMVPSSFVFQQASKFRIELSDRFTGQKTKTPLTPRLLVTQIVEMAQQAHQNKRGLL